MKCKKCGCDTLFKDGDWYKCANCGATMFDIEMREDSPTRAVEAIDSNFSIVDHSNKSDDSDNEKAESAVQESQQKQEKKKSKKKDEENPPKSKIREIIEFCTPIVIAVVIAIILKTLVFANAVVPTGSMLNTIQEGDRIIASRLAYINEDPQRYDVVIFKYPDDETQPFVKRIIGLPGETVEVVEGTVYVTKTDGETIQLDDSFVTVDEPTGDFGPYEVPEGCYFMMGDNRNNSWDSRYWDNKFVSEDKIIGKVMFRYFPNISKIE